MSLTDQIHEATDALSRRLKEEFDAQATRLAERLTASLESERTAAAEQAREAMRSERDAELASALEKARAEAEQHLAHALAAGRAEAEHQRESAVTQARTEAQQQREAAVEQAQAAVSEQLEAARTEARGEVEVRLGADLERALAERELSIEAAMAEARLETERRLGEVEAASRADAEQRLASEIASARAEAQRAVATSAPAPIASASAIATVRAQAKDVLEKQRAASRVEADRRLEAEMARVQAQHEVALERALSERGAVTDEQIAQAVDAALAAEAKDDVSPMWAPSGEGSDGVSAQDVRRRGLDAVRRLDAATSLSDVLDALLVAVGADAARAAVLVRHGGRLRGWGADGFGDSLEEPRSLELEAESSDLIGRAMADARAVTLQPEETAPSFAQLPTGGVAVAAPVMVGGRAVGVVYADDAADPQRPTSSGWLESVELLTIHASRVAESLTAARAVELLGGSAGHAGAGSGAGSGGADRVDIRAARRYARLLVSEIKLYNENAVRSGREHRDLASRLGVEISRARAAFAERMPADMPSTGAVFAEELVRTLADGDDSLMGEGDDGATE